MQYEIQRKIKGTRVLFYPTINGVRINRTNYARKYDARATLRETIAKYSEAELLEKIAAYHARQAARVAA